jgi:hypothetical protein
MTARIRDHVLDILERHLAAAATEIAELLEDVVEERVTDRVADLREQLEQEKRQ